MKKLVLLSLLLIPILLKTAPLDETQRITHLLNRIGFGRGRETSSGSVKWESINTSISSFTRN
jgi:hypothetical protein